MSEKQRQETSYLITPGNVCSPKGSSIELNDDLNNPFSFYAIENPIFWRVAISKLKCYEWSDTERHQAEKKEMTRVGYPKIKNIFGNNCPDQDKIKCKKMSILEWQNEKRKDQMIYGMYDDKDEHTASNNVVFSAQVFDLNDDNEQLFVCEISIKRQGLLALIPGEDIVHILEVCEVSWKYCMSCRIETDKRFMKFSDALRETCAAICVAYPEFYCMFSIKCFSLGVFRSDLLRLEHPIQLPSYVLNKVDDIYNSILSSNTEEFFIEPSQDQPIFTVTISRRCVSNQSKELEKIVLSTVYMNRHDNTNGAQWPKGTMINDITLLSANLLQEILPLVFYHIQFYYQKSSQTSFNIQGSFLSYRGDRIICFTDTSKYTFSGGSMAPNWWKKQVDAFQEAYNAAMKELIITNLPVLL